jgi:hypothetical protein
MCCKLHFEQFQADPVTWLRRRSFGCGGVAAHRANSTSATIKVGWNKYKPVLYVSMLVEVFLRSSRQATSVFIAVAFLVILQPLI